MPKTNVTSNAAIAKESCAGPDVPERMFLFGPPKKDDLSDVAGLIGRAHKECDGDVNTMEKWLHEREFTLSKRAVIRWVDSLGLPKVDKPRP